MQLNTQYTNADTPIYTVNQTSESARLQQLVAVTAFLCDAIVVLHYLIGTHHA